MQTNKATRLDWSTGVIALLVSLSLLAMGWSLNEATRRQGAVVTDAPPPALNREYPGTFEQQLETALELLIHAQPASTYRTNLVWVWMCHIEGRDDSTRVALSNWMQNRDLVLRPGEWRNEWRNPNPKQ